MFGARRGVRDPRAILALLAVVWAASAAVYYTQIVRPYGLLTYLHVPGASPSVISHRSPLAGLLLLLTFVAAFALYAGGYLLARGLRTERVAAAVIAGGVALAALLVLAYPIGANDLFNYIVQGELLVMRGLNPMVYPPNHVPDLPLLGFAAYRGQISPYGPLWTWLEAATVAVWGAGNLLTTTLGFKFLALVGYLACCRLLAVLLRRRTPGHLASGMIFFAWNPLVLYETAANGHMDIWIGVLVLATLLFWEERRHVPALVTVTLAPLIKIVVAPLVPLFAAAAWRDTAPSQRRRLVIVGGCAMLAAVALSYLLLPEGLRGTRNLIGRDEIFTHSLPSLVWRALRTDLPEATATRITALGTLVVFALYSLLQVRNAWRTPDAVARLAFNSLLFLLLLCMPWFQPWYLLWVIPLAALQPRPDAPFQAALFSLTASWSYVVYGFLWFASAYAGNRLGLEFTAVATTFGLSWAYAVWSGWCSRFTRLNRDDAGLARQKP